MEKTPDRAHEGQDFGLPFEFSEIKPRRDRYADELEDREAAVMMSPFINKNDYFWI